MAGSPEYLAGLVLAGLAGLGVTLLPRLLSRRLLTVPMVLVALGLAAFWLPLGLPVVDPLDAHGTVAQRLTEFAVVTALMACGLKLDRVFSWKAWKSTWLLLGVAMPLCIAAMALLGVWAGLPVASALLLGAVLAPTDPVLASEVQVGPPGDSGTEDGDEDEVRFALTAEAGLNDGLAFPFVKAAILMATVGASPAAWGWRWLGVDLLLKTVVGFAAGAAVGWLIARLLFRTDRDDEPWPLEGPAALAAALLSYAVAELAGGYGFLAVFVAGLAIRRSERDHEFHERLHDFADAAERLLMAAVLVGLGGALADGVLGALDWRLAGLSVALVLVVRPASALVALLGARHVHRPQRWGIALFGIRGLGSLFYLAYALQHAGFAEADRLWATVAFTVLLSMVLHGFAAGPLMQRIERSIRGSADDPAAAVRM